MEPTNKYDHNAISENEISELADRVNYACNSTGYTVNGDHETEEYFTVFKTNTNDQNFRSHFGGEEVILFFSAYGKQSAYPDLFDAIRAETGKGTRLFYFDKNKVTKLASSAKELTAINAQLSSVDSNSNLIHKKTNEGSPVKANPL